MDAYVHESDQSEDEGPSDGVANIEIDQNLPMRVVLNNDIIGLEQELIIVEPV
jgi:hypothetical protein